MFSSGPQLACPLAYALESIERNVVVLAVSVYVPWGDLSFLLFNTQNYRKGCTEVDN